MQESNIALHFMVKTILAANTFKNSTGLPYINIYTNKVYGGITAISLNLKADICFAEPSMVGFAGQHIVKNQARENLPEDFKLVKVLLEKGMCDGVYHRKEINEKIIGILKLLLKKNSEINSELSNETSTNIEQATKAASKEIDLSLDGIKRLCLKLGSPEKDLKFISVIGTNGKFSTIAAIRAILKDANIKL